MPTIEQRADTTDPRVGTTFTHPDGWLISVDVQPDPGAGRPDDNDESMTPAQLAAWERGEWASCTLVVTVSREGVELSGAALGTIEHGLFTYTDEHDNVTGQGYVGPYAEAVDDLIEASIEQASATLAKLCASVTT